MNSEKNNRVIRTSLRNLYRLNAIHLPGLILIDPGIINIDISTICLKFLHDIDNLSIPHIRAIFLEGKAKNQHLRIHHLNLFPQHQFDNLADHIQAHVVIDTSAGKDHFRVIAGFLGLMGQIVRIDTDAVASDQARAKRQEIPLRARCIKDFMGIDTQGLKISDNSLTRAMLTSRCVFSMTLAASATLIEFVLYVPAFTILA